MDTRKRVLSERGRNPKVSAAEIARIAGVSRERVRQILKSEGMETAVAPQRCIELDVPGYRREYVCWWNMIDRCTNPANSTFKYYGARGIRVCERWMVSFEDFFKDMGPRPGAKYSIDRINNDGNYEPSNCRWADRKTQMNNIRRKPPKPKEPKGRSGRPKKGYTDAHMRVIERYWPVRKGMTGDKAVAKINELIAPRTVTRGWLYRYKPVEK